MVYRGRADGGAKCERFARCTKIRQNASKRPIRADRRAAYTYAYPRPRKPRMGRFNPVSGHFRIPRKPRFPVRQRNPPMKPRSGCPRFNPVPWLDRAGSTPKRKNPTRGGE